MAACVRVLVDEGNEADLAVSFQSLTALQWAEHGRDKEIVDCLIAHQKEERNRHRHRRNARKRTHYVRAQRARTTYDVGPQRVRTIQ